MIQDLHGYPTMRPTSISWLPEIPAHWDAAPLCALARPKSVTNKEHRELLSVYLHLGVVRFSDVEEKRTNATSKDLSKYQAVDPGDFVLNNQQAWRGSVGVSAHKGIVSPAYLVLSLNSKLRSDFANLLFRERTMVSQYLVCSKGVGSIQRNLYWPHLKRVTAVLPPLEEQAAIVRFLGYANGRIQRYVNAKQQLIKLLEEQKQVIIHRAVTRGVEPSVRLKASGLKWVGDVPKHWDVRPAKYFVQEVNERSETGTEELLSVSHLVGVKPRSTRNITMFKAESYVGHKLCRPGDLVINTMWAWMGALGVSRLTGIISPSYHVYRQLPDSKLTSEYGELLVRSWAYVAEYRMCSTGIRSSRLRFYPNQFLHMNLLCPPIGEQEAIVEHVERATSDLNHAITQARKEIALMREYRTRLIADVVTGQLDVREAARGLPDTADHVEAVGIDVDEDDDFDEDEGMEN